MARYYLTDEEIILLDGRCRPEIQSDVDAAKARLAATASMGDLSPVEAGLVADIVRAAREKGRLVFFRTQIRHCPVCKQSGGYATYRSGRNRGRENWSRPLTLSGVELVDSFVRVQHSVNLGCCIACWSKVEARVRESLADVQAEIPQALTGCPPKWRYFACAKCSECGWQGHEGEMRRLRALLGDGWYPGGCPKCPAVNLPLGPHPIDRTGTHVVVPATEASP